MSLSTVAHPWILGSFALYAPNLHAARKAYEMLRTSSADNAFGTVLLRTGETVDWVNMCHEVGEPEQMH